MEKFKVGDKVRVVDNHVLYNVKVGSVGVITKVSNAWVTVDFCGDSHIVANLESVLNMTLSLLPKRGRPRKGEERHRTKTCREEVVALKSKLKSLEREIEIIKETSKKVRYKISPGEVEEIIRDFIAFVTALKGGKFGVGEYHIRRFFEEKLEA